jgi:uncharacterized C2H2 Zn-finger protein
VQFGSLHCRNIDMAHPHYLYSGYPANVYLEEQLYATSRHGRPDILVMNSSVDAVIDPNLENYSPHPQLQSQWKAPHQIQRYLDENSKALFHAPAQVNHMHTSSFMHQLDTINPIPPPSLGRQTSPVSQQPSSASSSGLSPPSESDKYYDANPATPPDMAMSPSFPAQTQLFAQWDGPTSHHFNLTGMATIQGNTCVNLQDITPNHDAQIDYEDSRVQFDSLARACSFSTVSSHHEFETSSNAIPPAFLSRQMSPDEMAIIVKEEIHALPDDSDRHQCSFNAPASPAQSHDEVYSEEEIEVKLPKVEDDSEWNPKRTYHSRNTSNSSRAPRPSRAKATINKRPSDAGSSERPSVKRARTESMTNRGQRATKVISVAGSSSKGVFACSNCQATFKDEGGLQKHVKQQHTRPFTCVFSFAECTSTFASKNEWKRHVLTQHLILQFWVCTQGACSKVTNNQTARKGSTSGLGSDLPDGTIFNRKDLYTQHVRRMHTPPNVRKALKYKKPTPEWDERLKSMQNEAVRERCQLPVHMECPAANCGQHFNGTNAWDERMEHVAKHLEKAATGTEPPVRFGGDHDPTLSEWSASPQVNVVVRQDGRWQLNNPLKGAGSAPSTNSVIIARGSHDQGEVSDEDADGEDDLE